MKKTLALFTFSLCLVTTHAKASQESTSRKSSESEYNKVVIRCSTCGEVPESCPHQSTTGQEPPLHRISPVTYCRKFVRAVFPAYQATSEKKSAKKTD